MLETYLSGAFVFDGELALLLAVIDVAELVVEQVRGRRERRRQTGEQHREQSRGAAHPAARAGREWMGRGEEHKKRRGKERRAERAFLQRRDPFVLLLLLSPAPVCLGDALLPLASRASSSSTSSLHTRTQPAAFTAMHNVGMRYVVRRWET